MHESPAVVARVPRSSRPPAVFIEEGPLFEGPFSLHTIGMETDSRPEPPPTEGVRREWSELPARVAGGSNAGGIGGAVSSVARCRS